jgi:hypothetical protein
MPGILRIAVLLTLSCGAWALAESFEQVPALFLDHPAIQYFERPVTDPVARLQRQLDIGETKLEFEAGRRGYLVSVLKQLGVSIDSQVLVFSKTSFQGVLVSPSKPRAIYFNDRVAVGWVQDGEVLELTSLDSRQGIVFYTLDVRPSSQPHFERRDVCLQCHQGIPTLGVPGLIVRSVSTGSSGMPAENAGAVVTDHRSPLADRWGGWYVAGTLGSQPHRGNTLTPDRARPEELARLVNLAGKVDTSSYLAGTSDVVALMTLEHQTRMTNLISRIGWDTRIAMADVKMDEFQRRLESEINEIVTYLLFADEAPLHEPIGGVSSFTKTFPQRGPRDKKGRSLRDFDLKTRLFRYPLSYMIYSDAFDSMPDLVRERVYRKLYDVLTGKDTDAKFARLSPEDRQNVREILVDTKPGLPGYWQLSDAGTMP